MYDPEHPRDTQPEERPSAEQWTHPGGSWTPPPPPPEWDRGWTAGDGRSAQPQQGVPGPYGQGGYQQGGYQQGGYTQGGYAAPGSPYQPSTYPPGPYPQGGYTQGGYGGPTGGYPQRGYQPGGFGQGPYPPGGNPPGPYAPGGWSAGWGRARPRRSLPSVVTALLLAVGLLVGLGIGHGVWTSASQTALGQTPTGSSGGTGASGGTGSSGGTGTGSGTGSSGGSTFNPFSGGTGLGAGSGSTNPALSGVAATASKWLVDIDTQLSYQQAAAAGTGIVLTSNGYILTNNHVIEGETAIKVVDVANGRTYQATVVGYDRFRDVAVIKLVGASGLAVASIANSGNVKVGDSVIGLGNAGGVGGTPSSAAGQVTALGQSITAQDAGNGTTEKLSNLIQTNAAIQPGDSGGALINAAGQVIGMDTAASTGFSFQTQGNEGFAIPINEAMSIASQIRAGRGSTTVHIGATAFLGVEVNTATTAAGVVGAQVAGVIANGAAASAGLAANDVITSLNGTSVTSPASLTNLISQLHPGDHVSIGWTTPTGQSATASVTLPSGPPQ